MLDENPSLLPDAFAPLLGTDPTFSLLKETAREIATADVGVMIRGETGTGKNLLARAIHDASHRRDGPLVLVHSAALREDLAGSELFGARLEGSTGSIPDHPSKATAAEGGTLVLDEIGDLPLADQDRLRYFLDSGSGADVRLIAVTHRDLDELSEKGRFRPELLFRLRVVTLDVPPLRRRPGDVELLIAAFQSELAERYGKEPPRYSPGARKVLRRYGWPGNVRELRNFCKQMVLTRSGRGLRAEELPLAIRFPGNPLRETARLPPTGIRLDDWIADLIRQALVEANGNRSQAARLLSISRDTLNYRIKKYRIRAS